MHPIILVAAGSAVGGAARWAMAGWLDARLDAEVRMWGTLAVNIIGGLLIGACAALLEREALRLLLITGVLGGFTTFSAYSLQTMQLLQAGRPLAAGAYALGSVLACLLACWAGWGLARLL
ncbi:MAG: CrcB family protein, partial [Planctomycetes bacterium]|nr:CrcB family protein [Planctomycetota bacterium]